MNEDKLIKVRFIPACAGNTSLWPAKQFHRPVHPRVCGEHVPRQNIDNRGRGSSPRVRGTLYFRIIVVAHERFIPACAGNTSAPRCSRCWTAVHPRVCGEHSVDAPNVDGIDGSSPRVRGTLQGKGGRLLPVRFIPACAGNTKQGGAQVLGKAVHPRVCGEHWTAATIAPPFSGSSPRVRGTPRRRRRSARRHRFIPACAGNTVARNQFCLPIMVHPRVCGEHVRSNPRCQKSSGSSPRVRGTRKNPRHADENGRFIPACAGNTALGNPLATAAAVHPRVCGEHKVCISHSTLISGSSPRVRGTHKIVSEIKESGRFIPACAGNTNPTHPRSDQSPVHPRVCGEHRVTDVEVGNAAGSSPRVRGTRADPACARVRSRFIPACAGNTAAACEASWPGAVHPRVCGEHGQCIGKIRRVFGSSPRVRGTHSHERQRHLPARFIPACAGNTGHGRARPGSSAVHPRVCGEHVTATTGTVTINRFIPACAGNTAECDECLLDGTVHPRVCGEHIDVQLPLQGKNGSSPRVRGTHDVDCHQGEKARFIPACAGNTCPQGRADVQRPVHPRVCGEHSDGEEGNLSPRGSSPRVRGTRKAVSEVLSRSRFIPACAGNTPTMPFRLIRHPVHPRVCGEHLIPCATSSAVSGSSPRVRGTPGIVQWTGTNFRFIPACAGNTGY